MTEICTYCISKKRGRVEGRKRKREGKGEMEEERKVRRRRKREGRREIRKERRIRRGKGILRGGRRG